MTDYARYAPMPYEAALRLCHLEAQHYALARICALMRDDIMRAAFTDIEQVALQAILGSANQRLTAAVAEFDCYKRSEPIALDTKELTY